MPFSRSRPTAWGAALLVGALTPACNGAGFAGGGHRGTQATPPAPLPNAIDERTNGTAPPPGKDGGQPGPAPTDNEGETADPPQPVSGAFLTCVPMDDAAATGASSFGCRIQQSGAMADLSSVPVTWDVEDAAGASIGNVATFTVLPPGSPFHVAVALADGQPQGRQVTASVAWQPAPAKAEALHAKLDKVDGGKALRYATLMPLHLGDGYMDQSDCLEKVEQLPVYSDAALVRFHVPQGGATVTVTLSGVCGIDYDKLSTLTVWDSYANADAVATVSISKDGRAATTGSLTLQPGDYEVEIDAGSYHGDLDDFVFKDLIIESSTSVDGGALVPL